ncbi:hypothetical protein ACE6H2_000523 [Prunus campanulata]
MGLGRGCVKKRGDTGLRNFQVIGRCDGQSGGSKPLSVYLKYSSDVAQISSSDLLARALVLVGARRRGLRENEVVGGGDAGFGFRV